MTLSPIDALHRVRKLRSDLRQIVEKDQEQEVQGMALPVLDAVLGAARQHIKAGDPVLDALHDLISPESIATGEPIRAVDALLVVGQVESALTEVTDTGPISLRPEPGPFDDWA